MKKSIILGVFILALLLPGCGSGPRMKDGFYSAEMSDYSHGWKEYVCIMVKGNEIVYTEFNAKDPSGYIKAWDNAYMQNMAPVSGTYPNEYTRYYVSELVERQSPEDVDVMTGATGSGSNFKRLAAAVIEQSIEGNSDTKVVQTQE